MKMRLLNCDSDFAQRMRGTGPYAELLARRFAVARDRLGFEPEARALDRTQFVRPERGGQLRLF